MPKPPLDPKEKLFDSPTGQTPKQDGIMDGSLVGSVDLTWPQCKDLIRKDVMYLSGFDEDSALADWSNKDLRKLGRAISLHCKVGDGYYGNKYVCCTCL